MGSPADSEEYDADDRAAVPGDDNEDSDEIVVPPVKRLYRTPTTKSSPPPLCAYHPLTGEPLTGLLYVSFTAPSDPPLPLPPMESSYKSKDKERAVVPQSPAPLSLCHCAAHNKRSPSHSSRDHCKANKSPAPSRSKVDDAAATGALLDSGHVDNMIYACAFHPQIDLQFHEPPSC